MPATSHGDVLLVNPSEIRPTAPDQTAQAEAALGVRMPSGYAAYVERLGEGALGHFVRVHEPTRLPDLTFDWRQAHHGVLVLGHKRGRSCAGSVPGTRCRGCGLVRRR